MPKDNTRNKAKKVTGVNRSYGGAQEEALHSAAEELGRQNIATARDSFANDHRFPLALGGRG